MSLRKTPIFLTDKSVGTGYTTKSKVIRIFLSSSFKDMHRERDYLKAYAFTMLDNELIPMGYRLQVMDLRGNAADSFELQEEAVFRMCLNGIEECKPRIIALLGDRYGWIGYGEGAEYSDAGAESRILLAIENIEGDRELDINRSELAGKSITHIEIDYAFKRMDPGYCFYYFREPLPYERMSEQTRAVYLSNKVKQDELKRMIEVGLPDLYADHVKVYSAQWDPEKQMVGGLEQLNELVFRDLKKSILKELAQADRRKETEALEFDSFLYEKTSGTLPRKELPELCNFALSQDGVHRCRLIVGESGTGKSTLFAQVYELLVSRDCFIIPYVAGLNSQSTTPANMLKSICLSLKKYLEIDDLRTGNGEEETGTVQKMPGQLDFNQFIKLREELESLLIAAAGKKRIVLLIDSLESLGTEDDRVRLFQWLPEAIPQNVRILATVIPGFAKPPDGLFGSDLRLKGFDSLEEIENGIEAIASTYSKHFERRVLNMLAGKVKEAQGLPLYAGIAVDYLMNMTANDYETYTDTFTHIEWMKKEITDMPLLVEELYERILRRAGNAYGLELVRVILGFVAASRNGLRSIDLMESVKSYFSRDISDREFLVIHSYLRGHLRHTIDSGWWRIEHNSLRDYILHTMPDTQVKTLNAMMLKQLDKLSIHDDFKCSEYLWYCYTSGNGESAVAFMADIPEPYRAIAAGTLEYLLRNGGAEGWEWLVQAFDQCEAFPVFKKAAKFLLNALTSESSFHLPFYCIQYLLQGLSGTIEKYVDRMDDMSELIVLHADCTFALSEIYMNSGEVDAALEHCVALSDVLSVVSEHKGTQDPNLLFLLTRVDYYIGSFHILRKDFQAAEKYCIKAVAEAELLCENIVPDSRDLNLKALIISLKAYILDETKDFARAMDNYRRAFELRTELCRREPEQYYYTSNLAVICINLANCCFKTSRMEEALEYNNRALEILRYLREKDPRNREVLRNLGTLFYHKGAIAARSSLIEKAVECFDQAEEYVMALMSISSSKNDIVAGAKIFLNMELVYKEHQDHERAVQYLDRAKELLSAYCGISENLSMFFRKEILEDTEYIDLYLQINKKLAHHYEKKFEYEEAIGIYRELLSFLKQVMEKNGKNREYLKGLSDVYMRLHYLYDALSEPEQAALNYTEAKEIKRMLYSS